MAYKYFPFMGTIAKISINKNAEMFNVKVGELVRWYIINAVLRGEITFNFAGGMIQKVISTDDKFSNSSAIKNIYEIIVPCGCRKNLRNNIPRRRQLTLLSLYWKLI